MKRQGYKLKPFVVLKRLLKFIAPYKWHLFLAIICSAVVALTSSAPAYIMLKIINKVLITTIKPELKLYWLKIISASVMILILVKGIFYYVQVYLMAYTGQKVIFDIRNKLFSQLQKLSLSYYHKNETGQLMSRVLNDVAVIQNVVGSTLSFITDFLTIVILIFWIFYLDFKLSLMVFIIIPVISTVVSTFSRKMRRVGKLVQMKVGDITSILQETISGIEVVKSFAMEEREEKRFIAKNEESFKVHMKATRLLASVLPVVETLNTIGLVVVLYYGGYRVIRQEINPGQLISFLTALGMLFTPLKRLTHVNSFVQTAIGAAERVFELIDADDEIKDCENAVQFSELKGNVRFQNVSFSYNREEKVLRNISLDVQAGEIIALVGYSGAGKTTLAKLIPRFYDPQEGVIMVDGIDIKKIVKKSLRSYIGIVPQETILFSTTIKDNIAYSVQQASMEEIIEAAKVANAHDFIMTLPKGYKTEVGERGVRLSGGQKQRIAIARAVLKDPKILILDEATSSLDNESEALIQEALERLMQGRTTFIIAHRLTTITKANRIIVLDKGEIVEIGTHEELLKQKGLYASLYEMQFQAIKEAIT